jgi:nicotinate-nucleotide pyrophosphorylase (carboxylating)
MSRDEPMSTDLAFPAADARELVRVALDEDLGPQHRDVTTLATIPADQVATAHVVARAAGVVAGVPVVAEVLEQVARLIGSPAPEVELLVADGTAVVRGDVVARVTGPVRVILIGERTMLNIVCRLRACAIWRSTPCGPGAARTSGWASTTSR